MANKNILIVDDEEIIVDVLKRRFERMGWSVHTAFDGETGISVIQSQPLDVIVCDIKMPSATNGTDVLATARKLHPETPFVAISGYILSDENVAQIMNKGADLFLKKPFPSLKEVTRKITRLVEKN